MNALVPLFVNAISAQNLLKRLLQDVAVKTGGRFYGKGVKHLYRAFEKTAMRRDDENPYRSDNVYDMARGIVQYDTLEGVLHGLETLVHHPKIIVKRAKNRFLKPTSLGWADVMVNFHFRFQDDVTRHICEVQLCHTKLITVRKDPKYGGHKEYSRLRNAWELRELLSL